MHEVPAKNTPSLGGWFIAAGLGAAAFGVAMVVFHFNVPQAGLAGGVVFLVTGLILGQADRPIPAPPMPAAEPAAPAAEAAAPAAAVATPAPAPAAAAPLMDAPVSEVRPAGLAAPRGGKADDLKEIEGIGPAMEKLCHELGFFHFDQIAGWSAAEIAWVDANLKGFKGRVSRDKWVAQAKIIVSEGLAAFRERAKTNDY